MLAVLLSARDSYTYGSAGSKCRGHAAKGPSALLFNYFTTPALRYAVMMVIPQIKVCGFYSPSPSSVSLAHFFTDGLQSLAAVTRSSRPCTASDSSD